MSAPRGLSTQERRDWLRLARSEGVGPVTFFGLMARCGSAGAALEALPDLARSAGRRAFRLADPAAIDREIAASAALGARIVAACEPDYPPALAALTPPPPVVTLRGDAGLAARRCVAIVGARNATGAGLKLTRQIAAGLGAAGVVVVSGLARGIDGAAHSASLANGTIAVVAGGIDHVYPSEHAELHAAIAERGLIVSESAHGHDVQARDFPRRNRLISGLSLGVIVVEAELRSGSLITARTALEQGREVFAVPGHPLEPRSTGPNSLIRQGATLVETAEDVLAALQQATPTLRAAQGPGFAGARLAPEALARLAARLDELVSTTPMTLDELARETGAGVGAVAAALVELELAGRVVLSASGGVSRAG